MHPQSARVAAGIRTESITVLRASIAAVGTINALHHHGAMLNE